MKNYVFDIETGPVNSVVLEMLMPPFDETDVATGNLKDPEKIKAKIDKARADHAAKFMRNAALSPLTGEILAIGVRGPNSGDILLWCESGIGERRLIEAFFSVFAESFDGKEGAHWIGFNIANFDVPFLVRRAWHHGIAIPNEFISRRFLKTEFTDIFQHWQLTRYPPEFVSLNDLALFFGLAAKEFDGAQFAELYRYEPDKARQYLAYDLELTWKITSRLGLFRHESIPLPVHKEAAPTILESATFESEPATEFRFF